MGYRLRIHVNDYFYMGFGILIYKYGMASTDYAMSNKIGHIMVAIGLLFLLLKIINTRYTYNEMKFFLILSAVCFLILIESKNDLFLISLIMGISMKNTNFQRIIKIWSVIHIFIFITTIMRAIMDGLEIYYISRFIGDEYRGIERYSYGFSHPNSLQGTFLKIACGIILLSDSNLILAGLVFLNFLLYIKTKSRTGLFSIYILICSVIVFRRKKRFFSENRNLIVCMELSIILLDILLVISFGKIGMVTVLDNIFTGRFSLAQRINNLIPYSFFGHDFFEYGAPFSPDNGIWNVLLGSGIVAFAGLVCLYCKVIKYMLLNGNYQATAIILSCTLYSISENIFGNIFFNPALLIIFCSVFNNKYLNDNYIKNIMKR